MNKTMVWDLRRLQKHFEKKDPDSLYLVFGDETYLVNETVKLIKEKSLPNGVDDFSFDQFFYPEASTSQVRDAVETLTMLSSKRVVLFRIGSGMKDKDWENIYPLLENPVESTTLVIVADSVDKRKKYYKQFSASGNLVELKRPFDNQIPSWIEYIAFKNNLELEPMAIKLLQQFIGNSLSELNNEILKLSQYLGNERRKVLEEDVLRLVSRSRVDSIFDLTNAIGRKDRAHALMCLANLLGHGQNEVGALSLISRHIRILKIVKEGLAEGLGGGKLSAKAGIPQFFLQEYVNQSKNWSQEKILKAVLALHDTDRALKTSPISSHIWLENFVVRTCS